MRELVFIETLRLPAERPDGSPGFRAFAKGLTAESCGLTHDKAESLAPWLTERSADEGMVGGASANGRDIE